MNSITFVVIYSIQSWYFCYSNAAEDSASMEHSVPVPNHSYYSGNAAGEQSAPEGEIITTESATAAVACDEREEHESTSNDNSFNFHDHQYAALFPELVQKGRYTCNLCGKMFALNRYLKRHLIRIHKYRRKSQGTTDVQSNSTLPETNIGSAESNSAVEVTAGQKANMSKLSLDIKEDCELCGCISDKSMSLEAHMESHRREEQEPDVYVCHMCGKVFDERRKFIKHVARDHKKIAAIGKGRYQSGCANDDRKTSTVAARTTCDICGFVFKKSVRTTSERFLRHMRSHTGEKPFKCGQCSLAFTVKGNLQRHEMLHAGTGRFICEYCAQTFHQKTSLWCHVYKQHADKLDSDPSKRPFNCRFCGERFYTEHHVRRHVEEHHKSTFCEVCGKMFDRYSDLQNHECASGAFGCNICDHVSYASAAKLNEHMLIHTTSNVRVSYKCCWCSEQFDIVSALESHIADKHPTALPKYHCSKCDKSFVTERQLNQHMHVHFKAALSCNVCGKRFKLMTAFNFHMSTHKHNGGTIRQCQCKLCGKAFSKENCLQQHMHVVHARNPVTCTVCGKKFGLLSTLTRHMLTHSTGGQHQCSHCEKSFSMESTLKLHLRLHSNNAFTCTVCSKKFMFHSELKYHMFGHGQLGECDGTQLSKRYNCAVCGKLFSQKQMLVLHERIHSGLKPHLCNRCGKAFRQRVHLTRHMHTHTNFKPYSCSHCSKAYSNRFDLRTHCTRVHNVQLPVQQRFRLKSSDSGDSCNINDRQDNVSPSTQ